MFARQDTPETAQKTLATLPEITTLLTIYALIGDDMRLIFSEKPADEVFNVITAATMVVFGLEVIINTFGKQGFLDPIDHFIAFEFARLNSANLLRWCHFSRWRNAPVSIFVIASLLKRQGICAASSFGSMLVQLSPWSWTWPTYGGQGNSVNSGFSEACCYDHQSNGSNVRRLTFWYHSPNRFMNVLAPFKEELVICLAGW